MLSKFEAKEYINSITVGKKLKYFVEKFGLPEVVGEWDKSKVKNIIDILTNHRKDNGLGQLGYLGGETAYASRFIDILTVVYSLQQSLIFETPSDI